MMGGWGDGPRGWVKMIAAGSQLHDCMLLSPALSITGLHGVALWAPPRASLQSSRGRRRAAATSA